MLRNPRLFFLSAIFIICSITNADNVTKSTPLVGSLNGAPKTLDPALIIESAQWHTILNLGINLINHDSVGRLVGEGAVSWVISPDFKKFSFKLNSEIKDSEGLGLDSADWKATLIHILKSKGSTRSFITDFLDEEGIETPNKYTLILNLKKSYQTFIERLTTPEFILLSRRAIAPDNSVDLHISSGPYKLKNFHIKKGSCTLLANHYYLGYDDKQVEEIILEPQPDSEHEVLENVASGRWSFAIGAPLPTDPKNSIFSSLVKEKKIIAARAILNDVAFMIIFDTQRISSKKERLAIAKIIASKTTDLNNPVTKPAKQLYPPGFSGSLPPAMEDDIAWHIKSKAKHDDLPKKLIGYASVAGYASGLATWTKDTLEKAGIIVESHKLSYPEYQSTHQNIDHDYVIVITGLNSKDPAGSLLTLLSPESGIIPDTDNHLNKLLKAAVQADLKKRIQLLHQISIQLLESGRIIPILHYGSAPVSNPIVAMGNQSEFDDEIHLAHIRLQK